jgi:hypothetical protein
VNGNVGYEGYTGAGITNYTDIEWDVGFTLTHDKYALALRYIDTDTHLLGGLWFFAGPFYVAMFIFKFP